MCWDFLDMFCVSVVWPPGPSLGTDLITIGRLRPPQSWPIPVNTQSILPLTFPPLMRARPPPLLPPSIDTASQGESEHTPSQMCVRCLNPNIEKHSTLIIWVSEKFRTFNSLLQPPTLQRKKSHRKPNLLAGIDGLNIVNRHCLS